MLLLLSLSQPTFSDITQHYVKMTISQPYGHWWHGYNHVNYMLGMWFHAIQLSSLLESLDIYCSVVDIETDSFTIDSPSLLTAVGQYHPMLTHLWLFSVAKTTLQLQNPSTAWNHHP